MGEEEECKEKIGNLDKQCAGRAVLGWGTGFVNRWCYPGNITVKDFNNAILTKMLPIFT